uniref:uncharacterized protein LOC101242346 n=1 Tax=Ciona intestinalis TaxID=7719 RepID=UPI0002B8DCF4|nr:uncharacterized protein LOC101242346 [Ciona intestinalis]|eukprot:XP_004227011.1 uncharacterized protein LOC101242346 [Ciona intestinalis]
MGQLSSSAQKSSEKPEEGKTRKQTVLNVGFLTPESIKEKHPMQVFQEWYGEAFRYGVTDPFLMMLATCGANCKPSCRIVALGRPDEKGFHFACQKNSKKSAQMEENSAVAATFYWAEIKRSVRVEGHVVKTDDVTSFQAWPGDIKYAVSVGPQQGEMENYQKLVEKYKSANLKEISDFPKPGYVQSFCLVPESVEFYQDRGPTCPNDRILCTKVNENEENDQKDCENWKVVRLYP